MPDHPHVTGQPASGAPTPLLAFPLTLVGTVAGIIAGFVANGLIVAAANAATDRLRFIWGGGLALVLGASALARLNTHFAVAQHVPYTRLQFCVDVALIILSSFAIGYVPGDRFSTPTFWWLIAGLGCLLLGRNIHLHSKGHHRWLGSAVLAVGMVLVVLLASNVLTGPTPVSLVGIYLMVAALVQIIAETKIFRPWNAA